MRPLPLICAGVILFLITTVPVAAEKLPVLRAGGDEFITLEDIATFYGLSRQPEAGRVIRMTGPRSVIDWEPGYRQAWVNGIGIWLHAPVQKITGRWAVTQTDVSSFIDPILRTHAHLGAQDNRVVALDPGHGGRDPGASSRRGLMEKTVALDIARRVRLALAHSGLRVIMTRDDDRYIPVGARCQLAATQDADIFVSIHLNSADNRNAQGLETYVLTAPGYPSAQAVAEVSAADTETYSGNGHAGPNACLAYAIQKATILSTGSTDRGLRHARFVVLKHAPCPAALVECGFLSNARDESLLRSSRHLDNLARGISKGILEYLDAVGRARVIAQQTRDTESRTSFTGH